MTFFARSDAFTEMGLPASLLHWMTAKAWLPHHLQAIMVDPVDGIWGSWVTSQMKCIE